jgi:MurNAc alpha-1-phosphate uridylyltransferase
MSAGLGTRLKPLTDTLPKPLVHVGGKAMICYVLELLEKYQIQEAMINVHYLPEKMRAFVREWNAAGKKPLLHIQDETQCILESGGGVALAAPWLFENSENAIVCNADVIADPDLGALVHFHELHKAEATLCVVAHPEAGKKYTGLRLEGDKIRSFEKPGYADPALFHFPGFYVLHARAVKRLLPAGKACSVVDLMWKPQAAEGKLFAWQYRGKYFDLGSVADLQAAEAALKMLDR